jgi:hypothetical protein
MLQRSRELASSARAIASSFGKRERSPRHNSKGSIVHASELVDFPFGTRSLGWREVLSICNQSCVAFSYVTVMWRA